MTNTIEENLRLVFGEHRHNVARFSIRSPDGDFTIEFTINHKDEAYWNIASYPPGGPPSDFEIVSKNKNQYWLVESRASDVQTAREELARLVPSVGGEHARIRRTKTFHSPPIKGLRDWAADLKDALTSYATGLP